MQFRSRRNLTTFDLVVHAGLNRWTAEVLDVTDEGVRVRAEGHNLEDDFEVAVELRGQSFPAQVVWTRGGQFGLAFEQPLPPDVLALISRSSKTKGKQRFGMR